MAWVVADGDGASVGEVVAKMRALGAPERARVFLNGRPADDRDVVEAGDQVELYPQRDSFRGKTEVEILAQRDGVLLVYKPAGIPAETTQLGEDSVLSELLAMFKGGTIHAASRLDVGVSGVMVCTLGRDANRRVHDWRAAGQLRRSYIAIGAGTLEGDGGLDSSGTWAHALGRMRDRGGRHKSSSEASERKTAITHYRVMARTSHATLLVLEPETGRMHQLRAHAALHGVPLYGDRLYGGPATATDDMGRVSPVDGIALHALRVALPSATATAPPPARMIDLWRTLGGDEDDFAL
jgi:23S rRNA-/tRNA-specific pseudouridylate synthase